MDNLFAQADEKKKSPNDPGCPSTDPAFHETIVNIVLFGPSGFLKVVYSMEIGSFFNLFHAFLCAMTYIPYIEIL